VPVKLNWKWIALRGVLAVLFGVVAIAQPAATVAAVVVVFGMYALVDGVYLSVSSLRARNEEPNWGMYLLGGIVGMLIGVVTLIMPGITGLALLYAVAGWAVVKGIVEMIAAFRLRKVIDGEWLYFFAGALSLVLGFYMLARPGIGAVLLLTWLAIYAIVFGILLLAVALRLRKAQSFRRVTTA
jgi:uncharacterized membrane protein HdeD (DUF308 family)